MWFYFLNIMGFSWYNILSQPLPLKIFACGCHSVHKWNVSTTDRITTKLASDRDNPLSSNGNSFAIFCILYIFYFNYFIDSCEETKRHTVEVLAGIGVWDWWWASVSFPRTLQCEQEDLGMETLTLQLVDDLLYFMSRGRPKHHQVKTVICSILWFIIKLVQN